MLGDPWSGCPYVSVLHLRADWVEHSTAEISSSRGSTVRAEQSCLALKGNTYGEIKYHHGSISHNTHAPLQRARLARELLSLKSSVQ